MKLASTSVGSILSWAFVALLLGPACSSDGSEPGPGSSQQASVGVCADECLKACDGDSDCDTPDGELCCDFGDGKACVDAKDCPRFCEDDDQCKTSSGEACLRVTLAAPESVCTEPDDALHLCKSDASCDEDEVCCTIYSQPVCLKADRCPQECGKSSDCDTDAGEVCCTTLKQVDGSLAADGLCIDPGVTACPSACEKSSDCNTKQGELCCDGLCRTSCEQSCETSSDCDGQVCCRTKAARSPWTHDIEEPGYDVPRGTGGTSAMGGTGGSSSGGSTSAGTSSGGSGTGGGTGATGGTGSADCETCAQAIAAGDFLGESICAGEAKSQLEALQACTCTTGCTTECAAFCGGGERTSACTTCIISSCSTEYGACAGSL